MTLRQKLLAAIALTIVVPVVAIGVALSSFGTLDDRFADARFASGGERVALDLKFAVTDLRGWQMAYAYGEGSGRRRFEAAARETEVLLDRARQVLTGAEATLFQLDGTLRRFMDADAEAWAALDAGDDAEAERILLGPAFDQFARLARIAGDLAGGAEVVAAQADTGFYDARDRARRELIAVGIGAALAIILLLVALRDVVRPARGRPGARRDVSAPG